MLIMNQMIVQYHGRVSDGLCCNFAYCARVSYEALPATHTTSLNNLDIQYHLCLYSTIKGKFDEG